MMSKSIWFERVYIEDDPILGCTGFYFKICISTLLMEESNARWNNNQYIDLIEFWGMVYAEIHVPTSCVLVKYLIHQNFNCTVYCPSVKIHYPRSILMIHWIFSCCFWRQNGIVQKSVLYGVRSYYLFNAYCLWDLLVI